jgi:ABC-type Fe3+/spermidine/putrescine transport system ATPase subunit
MVFQRYALFPHMSVAENVAFPLKMRGIAKDERQRLVEDALLMVRLDGYGARQPNQLSGGQQQRVALARALVYKPPVLLMDEPLGALDRKLREELQLELRQLQREVGTTVVYVTHDQSEALTMADRIGVIHEGTMRQVGTPRDLYERPASTFVAGFVGETNVLDAVVVEAGPSPLLRTASGDGVVVAGAERPVDPGAAVRVGIRPERLSLAPGRRVGALNGTITQAVYVGEIVRYELDVGASLPLQVKVPAAVDPGLEVGTVASASFDPWVARLFVRPGAYS